MRRSIILLIMLLGLAAACRGERTYETALEALAEFPGYLNDANADTVHVLARQDMPLGEVLLYAFEGTRPDVEGLTCVATTFVSEEQEGRWRAQSSGSLGCEAGYPETDDIVLAHTGGGNITGLATVYGLAPGATTVRVQWVDGLVTTADVEDGYVLVSRPETVQPFQVELLDAQGDVIHEERIR